MIFSNAGRERLFEADARWPTKIAFRMLLNLTCLLSIACALFTLTDNSDSSVIPFSTARAVLIYAPCVSELLVCYIGRELSCPGRLDNSLEYDQHLLLLWKAKGAFKCH